MHRVNLAVIGASALVLSLHAADLASAQIVTVDLDDGLTPQDLVDTILGESIPTANVTYVGSGSAAGVFMGGDGIIGFDSGIILSSGSIADVPGPNSADDITTAHGLPGDEDLDELIPGFMTQDAAVLEFDFECETLLEISFQYVFSSDEYNEFVNTGFNDVFGFFVNGVNVALLPDAVTVVSINTVNGGNPAECGDGVDNDDDGLIDGDDPDCGVPLDGIVGEDNANTQFYINNDCTDPDGGDPCPLNTEMDGLTVVLNVSTQVQPGINHIKLAIADASDANFDSNVLIKAGSFKCAPPIIDCNDNGIPDDVDIADGTSEDCNGNAVPDECDIADGTSMDVNENGVPDECDVDCNGNGVPDDVDIAQGTSADVNGNGVPDECEDEIGFNTPLDFGGAGGGNTEALADMDGNGTIDVAAVIPGGDPQANGAIQVYLNQGVDVGGAWLGFDALPPVAVGRDPSSIALGDFNGDTFPDVAVTNAEDDTVSVLFNLGQGDGAVGPPTNYIVGDRPTGVVTIDLELDGDVDLAVGNEESQTVTLLINDGAGNFASGAGLVADIALQLRVLAMSSGDYDDDKCPDVSGPGVGGLGPALGGQGQVFVLLDAGNGTFHPPVYYDVGMVPTGIASADVNGDGKTDILTANSGDGTMSILLNLGDGTFGPALHVPVGTTPLSLSVIDLNGDNDRDVAIVAESAVHVLANTLETGQFGLQDPVVYDINAPPKFIAAGDLNQDNIADLVTANDSPGGNEAVTALLSDPQPVGFPASMDIKPGGCPNPLNRSSNGRLPVALLGRADFDVTQVDLPTVRLERDNGVGGPAFPNEGPPGPHTVIDDVGTPFGGRPCACHGLHGDGIDDLSMKFNTPEVVAALELDGLAPGASVKLSLRGNLLDGTPFKAVDCIILVPLPPSPGLVHSKTAQESPGPIVSDVLDAWGPCIDGAGCAGDLDGDGAVGVLDLMDLLSPRN